MRDMAQIAAVTRSACADRVRSANADRPLVILATGEFLARSKMLHGADRSSPFPVSAFLYPLLPRSTPRVWEHEAELLRRGSNEHTAR